MKLNGIVSTILASSLLLGSAGLAAAATSYSGTSADNPFSIYQERGEPSNAGTAITAALAANANGNLQRVVAGPAAAAYSGDGIQSSAEADNPFALYRERGQPANGGTAVLASHIATASDNAIAQVASDPFN